MDEAPLSRALEPFFSTKPPGQGTGLGLSMAKGFVEQSGGGLTIDSRPGQGPAAPLWLRASIRPAVPTETVAKRGFAAPTVVTRDDTRRCILLVDDETM